MIQQFPKISKSCRTELLCLFSNLTTLIAENETKNLSRGPFLSGGQSCRSCIFRIFYENFGRDKMWRHFLESDTCCHNQAVTMRVKSPEINLKSTENELTWPWLLETSQIYTGNQKAPATSLNKLFSQLWPFSEVSIGWMTKRGLIDSDVPKTDFTQISLRACRECLATVFGLQSSAIIPFQLYWEHWAHERPQNLRKEPKKT